MSKIRRTLAAAISHLPLVIAVSVGAGLAHIGTSTMPFQVGALMDGAHLTAAQAGQFGFFEVASLAAAMFLISAWIDRIPPLTIALCSCLLAVAANIGLYFAPSFYVQLLFGALSGAAYGFVFAATVAAAATSKEPDRLYGISNGAALLIIVGVMSALPVAGKYFGPLAVFAVIAALAALCAPLFFGFNRGRRTERTDISAWRVKGAPGLLFSWAAFSTGTGGLYAFSERIGHTIMLPAQDIAFVLSAGTFVGVAGTGAAAILGTRLNRRAALIIGMVGSGVACLLLGYATNLPLYIAGVFAYWVFYMFLYSYLLGTAAILDSSGRVGTLGGGAERLGYALGPWSAGILVEHTSYAATGMFGFLGCVLGLFFGLPSVFRALKLHAESNAAMQPAPVLAP